MEIHGESQKIQVQKIPEREFSETSWRERIRQRFNQVFGKESTQEGPRIAFDFFFTKHETDKDIQGFSNQLKKCDVFVPELPGWTPEGLHLLREISRGKKGELKKLKFLEGVLSSFAFKQREVLFGSHKPIVIIDIPFYHDLYRRHEEISIYKPEFTRFKDSFSDEITNTKEYFKRLADYFRDRESYMLSQIRPKIQEVLKNYRSLRKKDVVKVLLSIGDAHTAIYHAVKMEGYQSTRKFANALNVYGFGVEAIRRYMFGKPVDDELAAKCFLEMLFNSKVLGFTEKLTTDTGKAVCFKRKFFSNFTLRDVEDVFEATKRGKGKQVFGRKVDEKGLKFPNTERELDEFLAEPLPLRPNSPEPKHSL